MIVHANIKSQLESELQNSSSVWIASAMISYSGWDFIQKAIPPAATQFYLIGIDLATEPKVFESILSKPDINARIYESQFTFHPKVYPAAQSVLTLSITVVPGLCYRRDYK